MQLSAALRKLRAAFRQPDLAVNGKRRLLDAFHYRKCFYRRLGGGVLCDTANREVVFRVCVCVACVRATRREISVLSRHVFVAAAALLLLLRAVGPDTVNLQ